MEGSLRREVEARRGELAELIERKAGFDVMAAEMESQRRQSFDATLELIKQRDSLSHDLQVLSE